MNTLRMLTMRDANNGMLSVCVNCDRVVDSGGFGTIYSIPNQPEFVVKRVELTPPEPIGNADRYLAHIKSTRTRLLQIKAEIEEREEPSPFIIKCINEIVEQALSTHWYFDRNGLQLTAVWFLQRRAPGRKLSDHFLEPAPSVGMRTLIARGLVNRMRTLRRTGLVHLDCVAENVFVDRETDQPRVTMIDLDGCGIVNLADGAEAGRRDDWEHRPFTLGHLEGMRLPPWYPQVGIAAAPRAGNYLFAERWVVLDTLIRILTWDRGAGALSWVGGDLGKRVIREYRDIKKMIDDAKANGHPYDVDAWTKYYTQALNQLRVQLDPFPRFMADGDEPECLLKFAELAQRAYLDPRALKKRPGDVSFYELYLDWLRP